MRKIVALSMKPGDGAVKMGAAVQLNLLAQTEPGEPTSYPARWQPGPAPITASPT